MISRCLKISVLGFIYFMTAEALTVSKCHAADSTCIKKSAQSLVPEFAKGISGLRPLDPLLIKYIDGSSPNLQIKAHDVVVTGLKDCAVDSISRDVITSKLNVNILCSVQVKGEYQIKGKLLVLPLDGKGHLNVTLTRILLRVIADLEEMKKEGRTHWNIKGWDFSYILQEKANIGLTNLFKGSDKLNEAIAKLLGVIANELVMEVGSPIVKAIASEVVDTVNDFFHLMAVEELVIN